MLFYDSKFVLVKYMIIVIGGRRSCPGNGNKREEIPNSRQVSTTLSNYLDHAGLERRVCDVDNKNVSSRLREGAALAVVGSSEELVTTPAQFRALRRVCPPASVVQVTKVLRRNLRVHAAQVTDKLASPVNKLHIGVYVRFTAATP